ncbi:uncharacterized protein BDR25DRAFT_346952 [Lindgomyces ingoldianus]|uniref:Uncharacterized protein n=1 Tax=Lindgomyces ingoldianus TaxID=673940 RepID=A0ACB6QC27_9PLEO|nr:uncharacterized protein BDR25DRAFT_346952 [Lindgomyces ingoldianus]KAF2463932.1 hypothetical protein BDR25DRAFT_346952 [Lindgomyces ingoldianus]
MSVREMRQIFQYFRAERNNSPPQDVEPGKATPKKDGKQAVNRSVEPLEHIKSIGGHDVGKLAILSFRALQLYRIAALQAQLLEQQRSVMQKGEKFPEIEGGKIDVLLQKYADAIRNYETLSQDIVLDNENVNYDFLGRDGRFKVVRREGSRWEIWRNPNATVSDEGGQLKEIGRLGCRALDRKRRVEQERRKAYTSRLVMALFGGVAIITPMLIMALHPGLVVDLVTASVATVLFAIIVAVQARDASGKDVLASTAAYAAVLVVFVGASLAPISTATRPTKLLKLLS